MGNRSHRWLSVAVLTAAAFYRPLTFWADNAWDLSSPLKPLTLGVISAVVSYLLFLGLTRATRQALAAAATVAVAVLVVMHWNLFQYPILVVALFVVFALLATRLGESTQRGVVYVLVAVFGLAPLVQVVTAHLRDTEPYPIVDLASRQETTATGLVEDILFVVVDGYPSLTLAEEWFGHDPSDIEAHLTGLGYEVIETGWTQFTFTGLSVPSMLELQPIAAPGPTSYRNRSSVFRIMRGDSLVASSLRDAGFTYFHVEGGWDGSSCGFSDRCLSAPWFDETMWLLLGTSPFANWLTERDGSFYVPGTLHATGSLISLRDEFSDGNHDYVFAHLLLPHDPYVVDSECRVLPPTAEVARIDAQLTCVDGLIEEIAGLATSTTAVLIVADHGPHTLSQRFIPAAEWTDAQIAERFSVFLTYRYPNGCAEPAAPTNLEVMRAVVSCAIDIELPPNHGRYLIGADNPEWVEPERMQRIQAQLEAGSIAP